MPQARIPELEEGMREAARECAFWQAHHDEFFARYPEQYVAVAGEEVVAAHPDLPVLLEELARLGLRPSGDVMIEFVTNEASRLLL